MLCKIGFERPRPVTVGQDLLESDDVGFPSDYSIDLLPPARDVNRFKDSVLGIVIDGVLLDVREDMSGQGITLSALSFSNGNAGKLLAPPSGRKGMLGNCQAAQSEQNGVMRKCRPLLLT